MKVSNAKGLGHEKDWVSEDRKAAGVGGGQQGGETHTGVRDTAGARSKKDLRDHNKDLTFILIDIEQKSTDGGDLDISIYWDGGSRFAN